MRYEGTIEAEVPKSKFYAFITDPKKVITILPDVQESKVIDATHFWVKSKVGLSYVRGSMSMNFELKDAKEGASAKVVGHGQGLQSSVDLEMQIDLKDSASHGTSASWVVEAKMGGLMAGIGSRLIGGAAEKYIKDITSNLKKKVAE